MRATVPLTTTATRAATATDAGSLRRRRLVAAVWCGALSALPAAAARRTPLARGRGCQGMVTILLKAGAR